MAITRVNGVVRNHNIASNKSRKTLRRKENKRNKPTLTSKHLANQMRKRWDFECRQSRRWVIAGVEAGLISGAAADILHVWVKAKTPEEQRRLPKPSDRMLGSDAEKRAHKEAWLAFEKLKKERGEAIRQWGNGTTVGDWWSEGLSKGEGVNEEEEDDDDDDDDDEGGVQLEPPEPVSP